MDGEASSREHATLIVKYTFQIFPDDRVTGSWERIEKRRRVTPVPEISNPHGSSTAVKSKISEMSRALSGRRRQGDEKAPMPSGDWAAIAPIEGIRYEDHFAGPWNMLSWWGGGLTCLLSVDAEKQKILISGSRRRRSRVRTKAGRGASKEY